MHTPADQMTTAHAATHIRQIRGLPVMLDADLAALYGVDVAEIRAAVEQQPEIFPSDFVCELPGIGLAFSEQGASMFASMFSNSHPAHIGIAIMRAFCLLRRQRPPVGKGQRFARPRAGRASVARRIRGNRKSRI